ncbi:histone deacetylase family protein [soil metagenome]
MRAVFGGIQLAHAPSRFLSMGQIIDYPESPERARRLLDGARTASAKIYAARSAEPSVFENAHAKPYLHFLKTGFAQWSKLPGAGPEMMPSLRPVVAMGTMPKHILGRAGNFQMDFACPITADTWKAVHASASTAITAADLVLKGEHVAYALCRPPGHHAYRNRASGFCYLNNTALAAAQLRKKHDRVAIMDIDVHHGNGTQSIFYARPDVLTVSIHADPAYFYPFYWGYENETGSGAGEGFNLNIPIPVKSGDDAWLSAVEKAINKIARFQPGALVVALGLDAHENDPLQGGAVTTAGFERIAEQIAGLNLPTVLVQEGGYLTEDLADNLAMFLTGFEGGMAQVVEIAAE